MGQASFRNISAGPAGKSGLCAGAVVVAAEIGVASQTPPVYRTDDYRRRRISAPATAETPEVADLRRRSPGQLGRVIETNPKTTRKFAQNPPPYPLDSRNIRPLSSNPDAATRPATRGTVLPQPPSATTPRTRTRAQSHRRTPATAHPPDPIRSSLSASRHHRGNHFGLTKRAPGTRSNPCRNPIFSWSCFVAVCILRPV